MIELMASVGIVGMAALIIGGITILGILSSRDEDFIENMNDSGAPFSDYLITIGMRALN